MTGPQDPDAGRRARARAVARRLHPDLGGDPEAYLAAMAAIDDPGPTGRPGRAGTTGPAGSAGPAGSVPPVTVPAAGARSRPTGDTSRRARLRRQVRRHLHGLAGAARDRLPRQVPGARRRARP